METIEKECSHYVTGEFVWHRSSSLHTTHTSHFCGILVVYQVAETLLTYGVPHLRWPDSRESIRGFANWTPFFFESRFGGLKSCESQVCGHSRESLARYENRIFFPRIDSRGSRRLELRIARSSKLENPCELSVALFSWENIEQSPRAQVYRTCYSPC